MINGRSSIRCSKQGVIQQQGGYFERDLPKELMIGRKRLTRPQKKRRGQETAPNIALPTMWAINQNLMRMFQNPAKQKGATLKVRSFLFGLWEVCILENEFTRMPPLRQRGSLGAMASVVDNKSTTK
eukprot:TRINITY_DN705_c0_g1_i5.p2 TRINITY_DN705_c0_g1~~TRINITY_DN705_c0_g1_i5.p2  ORF type:complete len:127 (-),score=18.00 TRINITY_DN705_c0_g1_i5:29-409(-)